MCTLCAKGTSAWLPATMLKSTVWFYLAFNCCEETYAQVAERYKITLDEAYTRAGKKFVEYNDMKKYSCKPRFAADFRCLKQQPVTKAVAMSLEICSLCAGGNSKDFQRVAETFGSDLTMIYILVMRSRDIANKFHKSNASRAQATAAQSPESDTEPGCFSACLECVLMCLELGE